MINYYFYHDQILKTIGRLNIIIIITFISVVPIHCVSASFPETACYYMSSPGLKNLGHHDIPFGVLGQNSFVHTTVDEEGERVGLVYNYCKM